MKTFIEEYAVIIVAVVVAVVIIGVGSFAANTLGGEAGIMGFFNSLFENLPNN